MDALRQLVKQLESELLNGRCVGVHCRQGIGRSSVVAASLLAAAGEDTEVAFQRIMQSRGRPVPDTVEQRKWVDNFSQSLIASSER